jgi:hypothetical protein
MGQQKRTSVSLSPSMRPALAKQGEKSFGMVHEIGLTDSCVILIDVGGPADGAAFIVTSRH